MLSQATLYIRFVLRKTTACDERDRRENKASAFVPAPRLQTTCIRARGTLHTSASYLSGELVFPSRGIPSSFGFELSSQAVTNGLPVRQLTLQRGDRYRKPLQFRCQNLPAEGFGGKHKPVLNRFRVCSGSPRRFGDRRHTRTMSSRQHRSRLPLQPQVAQSSMKVQEAGGD